MKTFVFIFIPTAFIFLFNVIGYLQHAETKATIQQNTAPVVTIISPKNNSVFSAGSDVHYSVTVSDKEDGDSKYDEINTKEVLLQVKSISDTSLISGTNLQNVEKDAPGLQLIRTSNCLNCHGFENKVIGPSFADIQKKYAFNNQNVSLLAKRIRDGSTGIWGKVSMPTHPDLNSEQSENMVKWILSSSVPGIMYYVGTEGLFRLSAANKSKVYLLTASYIDHGINNTGPRLEGHDVSIIHVK